jgi:hypothetical protein
VNLALRYITLWVEVVAAAATLGLAMLFGAPGDDVGLITA